MRAALAASSRHRSWVDVHVLPIVLLWLACPGVWLERSWGNERGIQLLHSGSSSLSISADAWARRSETEELIVLAATSNETLSWLWGSSLPEKVRFYGLFVALQVGASPSREWLIREVIRKPGSLAYHVYGEIVEAKGWGWGSKLPVRPSLPIEQKRMIALAESLVRTEVATTRGMVQRIVERLKGRKSLGLFVMRRLAEVIKRSTRDALEHLQLVVPDLAGDLQHALCLALLKIPEKRGRLRLLVGNILHQLRLFGPEQTKEIADRELVSLLDEGEINQSFKVIMRLRTPVKTRSAGRPVAGTRASGVENRLAPDTRRKEHPAETEARNHEGPRWELVVLIAAGIASVIVFFWLRRKAG